MNVTNKTFNRLFNEWSANSINDGLIELCRRNNIAICDFPSTDTMVEFKKRCKKAWVWLEDMCESELYVAVMPFGGYTKRSLLELKDVLKEYRQSGGSNKVYRLLLERYE